MAEEKKVEKRGSKALPLIGFWAFVLALLLGVVGGVVAPGQGIIILILVILGIVVGLLNITEKEITPLLLAAIALIVVGTAGFPKTAIVRGAWFGGVWRPIFGGG